MAGKKAKAGCRGKTLQRDSGKKLAELRNEEAKREADEGAQASAKQRAAAKVAAWGAQRRSATVLYSDAVSPWTATGETKKALAGAYKRAMLNNFIPIERGRTAREQRILAAEVTKWITPRLAEFELKRRDLSCSH